MRRCAAAVVLLLVAGTCAAQDAGETQRKLQQVRSELRGVAGERRQLEGQRGDASRRLREADEQVGGRQRALRQTEADIARDGAELARLQGLRGTRTAELAARRAELAALLRAAQGQGRDAPLKSALAQDQVAAAERALILQGYLQRAQAARVRELVAAITELDGLEAAIHARRTALDAARSEQARAVAQLQDARKARASVLADLDRRYQDRSAREKALGQDARALQSLLAQLRAAAARAEREAAREAERQAARARADARRPGAAAAGRPATAPRRPVASVAPAIHVGGLAWPVSGSLLAGFGGRLPDGRRSDGVLVAAPAGTTVKAVADGTVVFADWMTGYGNILIIDHGSGYMSLYAHNDGLLREAGQAIRRGDPVATVGSSGGQQAPALYFELRRNGAPVNPQAWLTRQ